MTKVYLNQRLKNNKGEFYGEKIPCLVLDSNKQFSKKKDGTFIVVEVTNDGFKRTLKDVLKETLSSSPVKDTMVAAEVEEMFDLWTLVDNASSEIQISDDRLKTLAEAVAITQPMFIAGQCVKMLKGEVLDYGMEQFELESVK